MLAVETNERLTFEAVG